MKKIGPKKGYFSRISINSENLTYCPTAPFVEFMFPNVAYEATVYGTECF